MSWPYPGRSIAALPPHLLILDDDCGEARDLETVAKFIDLFLEAFQPYLVLGRRRRLS